MAMKIVYPYNELTHKITIPYILTLSQQKSLQEQFDNIEFNNSTFHPHPLLAMDRKIGEQMVYDQANSAYVGWIHDVGGNSYRHQQSKRENVWSSQPFMDFRDLGRKVGVNSCKDRGQDCRHQPFVSAMFIHSLYYLKANDLITILVNTKSQSAFALVHEFTQAYGKLGEAEYDADDRKVEMHVPGQMKYEHSNLLWLYKGYCCNGIATVAAKSISQTKYGTIYQLTLHFNSQITQSVPKEERIQLKLAMQSETHYGKLQDGDCLRSQHTNGIFSDVHNIEYANSTVSSFMTHIIFHSTNSVVKIPKKFLVELISSITFHNRSQDRFAALSVRAKNIITKYDIPIRYHNDALSVACAIANVSTMKNEIGVLKVMHGVLDEYGGEHSKLLRFQHSKSLIERINKIYVQIPNPVKKAGRLLVSTGVAGYCVCVGGSVLIPSLTVKNKYKIPGYKFPNFGWMFGAAAVGVAIGEWTKFVKDVNTIEELNEMTHNDVLDYAKPHYDLISYDVKALPLTISQKPLMLTREGGQPHIVTKITNDREVTGVIVPIGVVVESNPPVAHASIQHNELISATNRAQPRHLPLDNELVEEFRRFTRSRFPTDYYPNAHTHEFVIDFDEWNSRYKITKQRDYIAAKSKQPPPTIVFHYNGFVKTEKVLLAEIGHINDKDPRMIQGCPDDYNVLVGPFMHAMAKYLKKEWDGTGKFYYPSGASAEDVGRWFEYAKHYLELDFARYDSTIHLALLELELEGYEYITSGNMSLKRTNSALVLRVMRKNFNSKTYTVNGITFIVFGTRRSGTQNTSHGNTMINVYLTNFAIYKSGCRLNFKMVALGDDNLAFFLNHMIGSIDVTVYARLGLKAEHKQVLNGQFDQVEFCSSKFYPVDGSFVLSAKIGRQMAKIGWFINPISNKDKVRQMMRGDALSHYNDMNHVPILRTVIQKVLELTGSDYIENKEERIKALATHEVNQDIYNMLLLCYGVTREQFDEIELLIHSIDKLPASINHALLEHIIKVDSSSSPEPNANQESGLATTALQPNNKP